MATSGGEVFSYEFRKWFQNKSELWIGLSGAWEAKGILESINRIKPWEHCGELRDTLREVEHWHPNQQDGEIPWWDINLLLSDGFAVWEATGALLPIQIDHGEFSAIGSGHKFGLGAMCEAATHILSPETIVLKGLEAAMHYDPNCGGVPWVKTITKAAP